MVIVSSPKAREKATRGIASAIIIETLGQPCHTETQEMRWRSPLQPCPHTSQRSFWRSLRLCCCNNAVRV